MKKQLFSMAMLMAMSLSASAQQLLPYQNPNLSAEARANDLLSRLTLEEKTKLMMDTSPAIARLGIPQFQWWNEALHGVGRKRICYRFSYHDAHGSFVGRYLII